MPRKVISVTPTLSIWFENGKPRFGGRNVSREEAKGCVREWASNIGDFLDGKPPNACRNAYREDVRFAEKWLDAMEIQETMFSAIAGQPAARAPLTAKKRGTGPAELKPPPLPQLKRYRERLVSRLAGIQKAIDSE